MLTFLCRRRSGLPPAAAGLLTVVILFTSCCCPPIFAQLNGRLADRPIGVGYVRDITQVSMFEYMQHLCQRLEIGKTLMQSAPNEQLEALQSKVQTPINGVSWYMIQGLIPSFEPLYFQEVVDATDARRLLDSRRKMMGDRAKIESAGEGQYKFVNANSWFNDPPGGKDPEEYAAEINQNNAGTNANRSYQMTARVVEKDGKQQVEQTWSMTQYYRFHDNLLFSSSFEELWDMELPSRASLTSNVSSTNDMGVEAYFDRIPVAIKQLAWNMLSSTAGVQMQQRDGERQTTADLRRSSLEFGLAVVKAVMFDVQETNGWVRFATPDEQSVRAEINFETRRNSELTKQLDEISSGNSRFAPILHDDAAATLHFCVRASEDSGELPHAAAAWLREAIAEGADGDSTMVDAATHIATSLDAFAENRVLEAFLKLGWTDESGGVIYGGLQVDDNPDLLQAVHTMAVNVPNAPSEWTETFVMTEVDGRNVLRMEFPEPMLTELTEVTSLRPSHLYVTHQNSCLWFALGGEEAIRIIDRCVARCSSAGLAARAPLAFARFDVERWLSYPQDDPTGIAGLLLWLDANRFEFPPNPMSIAMASRSSNARPAPLLQRCIDLGGELETQFSIIGDSSGLRASLSIGEAAANYYIARMIDTQESFMREQRERAEARAKESRDALKDAAASSGSSGQD